MKKNKQLLLSTCIMLACTLLTTIAFANNDTLNKIANEDEAFFYPQVKVQNKTRFTATVKITYPGCKNDENIVIAPGGTGLGKSGLARAGCLVTKIEATFAANGAASVTQITNFSSTGTGADNFAIAENATNPEQTAFECRIYRSNMEGTEIGLKPGFVIHNNINVKNAGNLALHVTIKTSLEGITKRIPFGESRQFDTFSGYFSFSFQFKDEERLEKHYLKSFFTGHYSGAPVLFSKDTEKPTYEIIGTIVTDENKNHSITESICLKKTNKVGDNMMTSATKLNNCGIVTFALAQQDY
jgi:hypothetical protein